jgi:predicted tellurium resistance membrane protein TerC
VVVVLAAWPPLWRELRAQKNEAHAVHELEAEFGNVLPTADDPLNLRPAPAHVERAAVPGAPRKTFRQAVTQIIIADVSMSLDNVLAVGGIAKDHPTWVLVVGLVLSVAFMGAAATFIAGLLKRYHWIAYIGLLIILYVAVQMIWDGTHEVIEAEVAAGLF